MISIPDTNNGDDQQENILYGQNDLERSDFTSPGIRIATTAAELRALMGNTLELNSPRGVTAGRLDLRDPKYLDQFTIKNIRGTRKKDKGFIEQMVNRLFTGVRTPSEVDELTNRVKGRFESLRLQNSTPDGQPLDSNGVSQPIILGQALMDSLYEQITEADVQGMAERIAADVPYKKVRNEFINRNDQLTERGMNLLNRLRRGNTNPAKVVLAFSAALDTQYFDPEIDDVVSKVLRTRAPGGRPLLMLNDVLDAPDEGMNNTIYKCLQRLSTSLNAYESADGVLYQIEDAPAAAVGAGPAMTKYREQTEKFGEAARRLKTVKRDVENLEQTLIGILGSTPPGTLPAKLQGYIDTTTTPPPTSAGKIGKALIVTPSGTTKSMPDPLEVRNMLSTAGGSISSATDYQQIIDGKQQGLTGADAADAILAEYTAGVGGVDDVTAKAGVANLTGRTVNATAEMRQERLRQAEVEPDQYEERREDYTALREKNVDGRSVFRKVFIEPIAYPLKEVVWGIGHMYRDIVDVGNTEETFVRKLKEATALPKNEKATLEQLTVRYSTLQYVTNVLTREDEHHITLSPKIAKEMTSLREQIVRRHMENIGNTMRKKGIDRLNAEDARRMGLAGANLENLPYDEIQDRLYGYLDSDELESGILKKVQKKVDRAYYRIGFRKRQTQKRRDSRAKYLWGRETGFLNPLQYFDNFVKEPVKSIFTGNSKFKVLDHTIGLPAKVIYPPVRKVGGILRSAGKWLIS